MISVQSIVDRVESILDAEGSDRYTFNEDYKYAINSSVEWLQSVFNKAFADKKLTEENLKDLIRVAVYQTNAYSRVRLDDPSLGLFIWSILKINPKPSVYPDNATVDILAEDYLSKYRDDVSFIKSNFSAKRLTTEQWEESNDNIFEAGNSKMLESFINYAYLNPQDYTSSSYAPGGAEVEVKPSVPNEFIAVTFLKYPTPIDLITDEIEFPKSLLNLVVQKALNFISMKQGDQTNLYAVSTRDIQTLVQLMV